VKFVYRRRTVEELIKQVTEKAGISGDQAKTAVSTVLEFLKGKVPGIGGQLEGLLGGGGGEGGLGGAADALKKKFGF
jgi:hypothetical protein